LGWLLLGAGVALLLTAAPAAAEISSVDAYGGQAQVLGKPGRHRVRAQGTTKVQGSLGAAGPGGAKSVVGGGKGNGGGGGVSASRPESSSSAAAGGQSPSIAATEVADRSVGSLSLSGLDVLLLVVIFVGLLGVGVLIRRLARQAG
jgi:hypothetical protein